MIKMTVQQMMDATLTISQIIRDLNGVPRPDGSLVRRQVPGKGRYRLLRLHTKLLPEFNTAQEQRDALITAYDTKEKIEQEDGSEVESDRFVVPPDKLDEFNAAWKKIADEEIEIDAEAIPTDQLFMGNDVDGCMTPAELDALSVCVRD